MYNDGKVYTFILFFRARPRVKSLRAILLPNCEQLDDFRPFAAQFRHAMGTVAYQGPVHQLRPPYRTR